MSKLWGGRFDKPTHAEVEAFTESISVDARLWSADIAGSIAHARMLGATDILSAAESAELVRGLEQVRAEFEAGEVTLAPTAEDIHSEIERLLAEKAGAVAGKLHTARSRNDQVATATRLYLRGEINALTRDVTALQGWLCGTAEQHLETILPGLTHMQHAQPVSLAHHLMAYFWMLERDVQRLLDVRKRVNVLPLGSAAMAGTSFPIDRQLVARELGFDAVTENSLDAVSDRDFVIEFLAAASTLMTHHSRLSEEVVLWSTPEFGFIALDDSVTTGSSIMPQKKNPDVAELIRGRVGRVTGALAGALMMLKALPLSYNRDLQEDKRFLFDGLDSARSCTRIMLVMLENARFRADRMAQAVARDFSNATDLADFLVRKGMAFRQAHEVVGVIVRHCLERGLGLEDLTWEELRSFHALFDQSVASVTAPVAVMRARLSEGGTAPTRVKEQILRATALLKQRM